MYSLGQLESIELRHGNVGNHKIKLVIVEEFQGLSPIHSLPYLVTLIAQVRADIFPDDCIVFNQEDLSRHNPLSHSKMRELSDVAGGFDYRF